MLDGVIFNSVITVLMRE